MENTSIFTLSHLIKRKELQIYSSWADLPRTHLEFPKRPFWRICSIILFFNLLHPTIPFFFFSLLNTVLKKFSAEKESLVTWAAANSSLLKVMKTVRGWGALTLKDNRGSSICLEGLLLTGNCARSSLISCSTDRSCSRSGKNETRSLFCLLPRVSPCAHPHPSNLGDDKHLLTGYPNLTFSLNLSFCKRRNAGESKAA